MHGIFSYQNSLGRTRFDTNDEVIIGEVELLQSERHQGKIKLQRPSCERKALYEGRYDSVARNEVREFAGIDYVCKDVGSREKFAKSLNHSLSTAPIDKPMMNDRNLKAADIDRGRRPSCHLGAIGVKADGSVPSGLILLPLHSIQPGFARWIGDRREIGGATAVGYFRPRSLTEGGYVAWV